MLHPLLSMTTAWLRSRAPRWRRVPPAADAFRQRGAARLQEIPLPSPFDVELFSEEVATRRGRPIVLRSWSNPNGLLGLYVPGATTDLIMYEQDTSPLHQEHIILHELSHLLCNHQPVVVVDTELAILMLRRLPTSTIRRALRRANYSSADDQEAEVLASLILERANKIGHAQPVRLDRGRHGALGRLAEIMEEEDESRR